MIPKPEMNGLGVTFAECEFRHSEAYARLLEVLGFSEDFEHILEVPAFVNKLELIKESMDTHSIASKLLFFAIVIENSSLFSQFANILSLTRFKGYMKNVSNIIAWTSVDEQIHANAGIYILNLLKEEGHVSEELEDLLVEQVKGYMEHEEEMVNWIYEEDFFTKEDLLNFMKYRIDESMIKLGFDKIYHITSEQYSPMKWFEEEVFANSLDDFFAKRPVDYTKHDKSITANDLF